VRAAANGDFAGQSAFHFNEPLGSANKIVERCLSLVALSCFVPGRTKLTAAANVRHCQAEPLLQEEGRISIEMRSLTRPEAAVACDKRRQAFRLQSFIRDECDRDAGPVCGWIKSPLNAEVRGVKI